MSSCRGRNYCTVGCETDSGSARRSFLISFFFTEIHRINFTRACLENFLTNFPSECKYFVEHWSVWYVLHNITNITCTFVVDDNESFVAKRYDNGGTKETIIQSIISSNDVKQVQIILLNVE